MKIAVYSIALNEERHAERWALSSFGADVRLVADTGSTDRTVALLDEQEVDVRRIYVRPWRFDDARNAALAMLPADVDVCVSLDMDEILTPGWREVIEKAWTPDTTKLQAKCIASPTLTFDRQVITGRFTHRWRGPVHEILVPTVSESTVSVSDVLIHHLPDNGKSRGDYLPLLRLAVWEEPTSARASHYLGRELYFRREWMEAIAEFERHLGLPGATWEAERCASMRYLAKCCEALDDVPGAGKWHDWSVLADPESREALVDAAAFHLRQKDWRSVLDYCERALTVPTGHYFAERYAAEEGPYDLAAVAWHYLGDREKALASIRTALEFNPSDARLRENRRMMEAT